MESQELKTLIHSEIKKITFKNVGEDEPLLSSGLLDSITAVDLAITIEEHSGKAVPFQEINEENFDTLNRIMNYLSQQ